MKILRRCLLLSFLIAGASGSLILGDTVLDSSIGRAEDKAVVFTYPKDGAKIPFQKEPLLFKGKVIGFGSKEIRDLDLKVKVGHHSLDLQESFHVRSDGSWEAKKSFSNEGDYTMRAILVDKKNRELADTTIKITLE